MAVAVTHVDTMLELLIMYGEQRKIIQIHHPNELKETIYQRFTIPEDFDIVLQIYNKDYDDYVDLENNIPENMSKIQVKMSSTAILNRNTENTDSTENHEQVDRPDRRWPTRFTIPSDTFGPRLKHALESKQTLNPAMTSALMESLYNEMTRYTYYPTPSQYRDAVDALLSTYPYLIKNCKYLDVNEEAIVRKWKTMLSDKFRNMRKRRDSDVSEVMAKKKRILLSTTCTSSSTPPASVVTESSPSLGTALETTSSSSSLGTALATSSSYWGLNNYLPERPPTEDDSSIKLAKTWMINESSKQRQDLIGIKTRMDLTFPDRRKAIIQDMIPLQQIKEDYPCLLHEDEILNEFHRLTSINIDKKFLEWLKENGAKILELKPRMPTEDVPLKDCNRLAGYSTITALPILLKEDIKKMLCPTDVRPERITTPMIIHQGDIMKEDTSYEILMDDTILARPLEFLTAIEVMFAVYYIFNIQYHPKTVNTLTFFQKIILGIEDKITIPRKVMSLLTKLK